MRVVPFCARWNAFGVFALVVVAVAVWTLQIWPRAREVAALLATVKLLSQCWQHEFGNIFYPFMANHFCEYFHRRFTAIHFFLFIIWNFSGYDCGTFEG